MARWRQRKIYLLLAVSILSLAACRGQQPTTSDQWLPPYLRLQLKAGRAQVQWPGSSEWTTIEGKASIAIEEEIGMIADEAQSAQFLLGDGSILELEPQAKMQLQNLRTFPRLHMVVQEGELLFVAQGTTYEFVVPACLVTILSAPANLSIKVNDEGTHLIVKEGVAACETEMETLTLPSGREMHIASPEAKPVITEYIEGAATATVPARTPATGSTATPTPSPTSTPTPTPTATIPPSTPTLPPPTEPPPAPTEPPPQPTKRSGGSGGSDSPPQPTKAPPQPTKAPPQPTNPPPQPTNPPPQPTDKPKRPTPTP